MLTDWAPALLLADLADGRVISVRWPGPGGSPTTIDSHSTRRDALERELLEPPRRPPDDKPLFTELLAVKENGWLTITLPDTGAKCLPVFSTPFRAQRAKLTEVQVG